MRSNRRRFDVFRTGAATIAADEKLVAFRMSQRHYNQLKKIAERQHKPITVLISETLDKKLKLEFAALRAEKFAAIRSQQQPKEPGLKV